ncbi:dihydroneopterin aldolase [Brevundimonas subvibrioides]|uniref:dihydroneopterin aldolase n=1 Tax=Brevundimonas subvibrioides TaxID=74313 RepID=UPI0022B34830|nr:dihydroneopterin aldolase [Brevundimonas subvibrioides]
MSQSPESPSAPRRQGLTIFVEGLKVEAGIGVYDHEHGRLQTLLIDVRLELGPVEIHGLADTVNYETVANACRRIVAEGHVGLVETFAERLALDCLTDARVRAVTVRVDKPGALEAAAGAGCELSYSR